MESPYKFETSLNGKKLIVETGLLAEQANSSVTAQIGETLVLATVVMGQEPRNGINYMPLTVDYEERYYAAGRIFGSRFIKRESRPTEEAILSGRLIDRALRPLFDSRIRNDIQVVITVLSVDTINDPDIVGLFAASCALTISNIPWNGPIGAVRVGLKDGEMILNPTYEERLVCVSETVVAGPEEFINMIEAQAKEIPENELVKMFEHSSKYRKQLIDFQKEIAQKIGSKKSDVVIEEIPENFKSEVKKFLEGKVEPAIYTPDKTKRSENLKKLNKELKEWFESKEKEETKFNWVMEILEQEISDITHENIIKHSKRPDGRKPDELRSLKAFAGVLPRTHGSGLFMRGNTQVLSSLTLGSPGDEQTIEGMETQTQKRFMHHYNFPPYSVGETGHMRGPGRREIGHGALAEKAIAPLIPPKEEFPYTIRLVSEVLSSNGSSSMASVCGSILALMDGGIPIKSPAAGIAMGLMSNEKDYKVLTDIQGPEDHHGDMDFKVAGTKMGVTAVQMDVKLNGVKIEMLEKTLEQAKKARLEILAVMTEAISKPRKELSPLAPRIFTIQINPEKIGAIIGTGGKTINEITKTTGVTIDIEDSGLVFVTASNRESADKALAWINDLTRELKAGEEFEAKVVRITDFGAFMELVPGQDGLLHISELIPGFRVQKVSDVLKLGQTVKVKIQSIDEQGKVSLQLADFNEFEALKDNLPAGQPQERRFGGQRRNGPGYNRHR